MSIKNPSVMLAGMVAIALSAPSLAEESSETIVVTAAGFEQSIQNAPASISVISREDLASRYYRDVTDALQSVPGVVVTGGGSRTDISMRGMGSNYTLLLVDGKRLSSRQTRPNSDGPGIEAAWLPPLEAIDHIEIIRGPMSTLYGSDALGGVINIITRKESQDWHGNVQLGTVVQENSNSGNERSGNFFVGGSISDDLTMQLNGQWTERDEDNIERGYAEQLVQSFNTKFNYLVNDYHELSFEVGISNQTRDSHVGQSAQSSGCRRGCSDSSQEYDRTHFSLSHLGSWGIGESDSFLQYESNDNKSRDMKLDNTILKSSIVMPFDLHNLTTGVEIKHETLSDTNNQSPTSNLSEMDKTQWAAFVEDEWSIIEDVKLTLGARVDHDDKFGSHLSPRIYSVWNIDPSWTLKGGVSTGFNAPGLRETTPEWVQISGGGNMYGNPDLEPETSVNKEIGLLFDGGNGLISSVTVYHNSFEDRISRVDCPATLCTDGPNEFGSDPTYRVNIDKAEIMGVESSIEYPISDRVDVKASYAYNDSEQKSGANAGRPLNQLPTHLANANVNWQTSENLSSWTTVTYRGRESQPTSSSDEFRAKAYTMVDTGVNYLLTDSLTLKAAIYNLFDKEIDYENYEYIKDGRRYWVGMDMSF